MFSTSAIFNSTDRTLNLVAADYVAKVVGFDIYAPNKSTSWVPAISVKRKTGLTGGGSVGAAPVYLNAPRSATSTANLGGDGTPYAPGGGDFTGSFDLTTDPARPMTFSYRCRDGIPVDVDSGNFLQLFVDDTYGSQDVIATIYWTEAPEGSYYAETEFTSSSKVLNVVAGAAGATITGFDITAPYTSSSSKPLIRALRLNNWDAGAGGSTITPVALTDGGGLPLASHARLFGTGNSDNVIGWWYGVSLDPSVPATYKVRFDTDKRIVLTDNNFFQLNFSANYIDDVVARIYFNEPTV